MANDSQRVIIRVCVTDIPGNPQERVYKLGRDFCQQILHRSFNNNLQDACHDAMHFLPNFDSENDVKAWFIYDFNVTKPLSKEEILAVPHAVYHATRQGDIWIFTPRERWIVEARRHWGSTGCLTWWMRPPHQRFPRCSHLSPSLASR
ncbi:hypothetical protein BKA65DRAFT_541701 [Rhexocercosporidium sp. MPI-PUGE-AT-0058]|nr:hypothetical protein BKA65DRAFT_541701 [Rhexocercosporidium sp. MPI-PUGE-AT-0058]